MRPECAWSMSTVGLTAQEISLPIENPFLRGSYCHSMAGSKSSWVYPEWENPYFSMESSTHHITNAQLKGPPPASQSSERHKHSPCTQRFPPKKSRPSALSLSCSTEPSSPSPADDGQVPSSQLSMCRCSSPPQTPDRYSKPLPPIPRQPDITTEQATDSEVEFLIKSDDRCCLMSDQCSKPSPFRYGIPSRRSFRDFGQINPAYCDNPLGPQSPRPTPPQHQMHLQQEVREKYEPPETAVCQGQQDKAQRKLRRSHSGPAGSLNKPSFLHIPCHKRNTHSMYKPKGPPPIPPRTSGAYSDEDKPPKVPPREPLSGGSSRTPSPKSLPAYVNGVMPPTQSFAPDPKYVSRGLQRQNSEGSPCIIPVIENGEKSATHYYLLPEKQAFEDSSEKFIRVMDCTTARNTDVSNTDWDYHNRRKAHVHLV
ncbi:ERBB receptor feedback inhibitor 1a [Sphaeramia orbicularis]|uniref:Uncharacterized protein n=1 Tax=Sphaeramia orbicularis TaxID=375764 RepID=A0A672ZZT2_9TELE|nr:ERBB receptor feedback inhibitor 1 [Sphaeramia orbicularis]